MSTYRPQTGTGATLREIRDQNLTQTQKGMGVASKYL